MKMGNINNGRWRLGMLREGLESSNTIDGELRALLLGFVSEVEAILKAESDAVSSDRWVRSVAHTALESVAAAGGVR